MKIDNNPNTYQKKPENQKNNLPGITVKGTFIPYTWLIMGVGALISVIAVIMIMTFSGRASEVEETPEQPTEAVEALDETGDAEEPVDDDGGRMWDEYIDESEQPTSDPEDTGDAASEEASSDEEVADAGDNESEDAPEPANNEDMAKTIEQFLIAYQIYGPGVTSQDRYDAMLAYGTEDVANKLIPTRGVDEAEASIDVTHELSSVESVPNEGVDNEYTVTLKYSAEAMGQKGQYTDVYTIRTDGSKVTDAIVRSMSTDN